MPENVADFGAGLERPADEVRLFLALREAAYQRLFAHVPWLRQQLFDAVEAYARGITIDREAIERAMSGGSTRSDPESMQRALERRAVRAGGDARAADGAGPAGDAARAGRGLGGRRGRDRGGGPAAGRARRCAETMRRRRATGGPAEQTFATLVGLELRPRRLREAATLWRTLGERRGTAGRDELWAHPDLLPSADDLDDPMGFVRRGDEGDEALPR